jgi:hypothetical protein
MKLTILSFFLFASLTSFSQTVYTRTITATAIQWDEKNEKFKRDTSQSLIKIKNPKIILSYDMIEVIERDTTRFYLNETPKMEEEDNVIKRIWNDANDGSGRECYVYLFFDKEDNDYTLRIVYPDDESGLEYYMMPLKVDVIPYSSTKQN